MINKYKNNLISLSLSLSLLSLYSHLSASPSSVPSGENHSVDKGKASLPSHHLRRPPRTLPPTRPLSLAQVFSGPRKHRRNALLYLFFSAPVGYLKRRCGGDEWNVCWWCGGGGGGRGGGGGEGGSGDGRRGDGGEEL